MPWARRVYVVTAAAQRPDCIGPDEFVVHHEALGLRMPTFNSHAIEASLHRIPGLSEHFVYFNDDYYARRPLSVRAFFDHQMRPIVRAEPIPQRGDQSWARVLRYTSDSFGFPPVTLLHAPVALTRSIMRTAEQTLRKGWEMTRDCSLRYEREGEIVPLLAATQLALHQGDAAPPPVPDPMSCAYSGSIPASAEKTQKVRRAHVVCINDLKQSTRSELRELLHVPGVEG
jgi:hypothetical protein